ncbi:hypothetical protein ACNJX9_09590 [Bradyrhizobium sp. DASA03076]|uniref:hypothetical protein n=1 Tax=Bradyrhizobium sp. BLXBL-03 TaxID=3395916 RepID=UPI003F718F65
MARVQHLYDFLARYVGLADALGNLQMVWSQNDETGSANMGRRNLLGDAGDVVLASERAVH